MFLSWQRAVELGIGHKAKLMEDAHGKDFITLDNSKAFMNVSIYCAMFHKVVVELTTRASALSQMCKHSVLFICHSTSGTQLWWSAQCFLQVWGLHPMGESAGRAIHNHRWRAWTQKLQRCQLDPRFLRKPAVTGHVAPTCPETTNGARVSSVPSIALVDGMGVCQARLRRLGHT